MPSPAVQDAGGVGATPSAEAVEAFLMESKVQAPHDAARDWAELSGRWGHQHSAMPDGLAGIGARGQEPVAPGPTLADVQADRDYERRRANDAQAQLKAIAAALDEDPERSPAWDDNDQPIPLVRRVEVALMPEGMGNTWIERKIMGHLDSYGVPTERNGITLTLASRVAVAAEGWRDHIPEGGKKVNG